MGGTPGYDLALLIEGQLFAEKKIFCSQRHRRAQTHQKVARGINEECVQRSEVICQTAEVLPTCRHQSGALL
jgi:phosphohistidine phosphatase SixA